MNFDLVKQKVLEFRDNRDRKQFHNPKDLAAAIAIESSELQEKFLRLSQKDSSALVKDNEDVKDELSDIFNYLILFADTCDIDLESAVLNKIEKNKKKYPIDKARGKSDKYTQL